MSKLIQEQANFEAFQGAMRNAESILERRLTDTEKQLLLLGVLHGQSVGILEGIDMHADVVRERLSSVREQAGGGSRHLDA